MEKLIQETDSNHMKNKQVTRSQHGLQKGKLCSVNLIAFYNDVSVLGYGTGSTREGVR